MPHALVDTAVRTFRLSIDAPEARSASGAGVYRALTAGGQEAWLKTTPAGLGPRALAAARRELLFYRRLAPTLPVRTPRLLDATDDAQGVVLLLAAAGTPRNIASWTPSLWARLGRTLAELHHTPLPAGEPWRRPDSLERALSEPDMPAITAFWGPALPQFDRLVECRDALIAASAALPPALVHGDCHTDNVLFTDDAPVLCDWQETTVARPVADLAFLGVRAAPAGVAVPPELLDAYAQASAHDRDTLERALLSEELAMDVYLWPHHAAYLDATAIRRIHARGRTLADRFFRDCEA